MTRLEQEQNASQSSSRVVDNQSGTLVGTDQPPAYTSQGQVPLPSESPVYAYAGERDRRGIVGILNKNLGGPLDSLSQWKELKRKKSAQRQSNLMQARLNQGANPTDDNDIPTFPEKKVTKHQGDDDLFP